MKISFRHFIAGLALLLGFTIWMNISFVTGARAQDDVPNLVGTWSGENLTVSTDKGYQSWKKTVQITEQKDRRFKGNFTYAEGTKNFFGVIFPDNETFVWVSKNSKGYNQGRILDDNLISACYVEAGEAATAGCAELTRAEN